MFLTLAGASWVDRINKTVDKSAFDTEKKGNSDDYRISTFKKPRYFFRDTSFDVDEHHFCLSVSLSLSLSAHAIRSLILPFSEIRNRSITA